MAGRRRAGRAGVRRGRGGEGAGGGLEGWRRRLTPLVDTHCHLADPRFDVDRAAVVARAREAGVAHVVVVADTLASAAQAIALAGTHGLSATAGVHPHEASTWTPETGARLEELLRHPAVVAVGETGLDYHYQHSPRQAQRRAFAAQLDLARRAGKPVVVHARDADADMAAMLAEWGATVPALVLHSFSSGDSVFDAGRAVGAYFGFSGMVTFRNWRLAHRVAACPGDRLLVETDAPYLAPEPHRGRRNEPAYVRDVARRVGELRGETADAITAQTTANAVRCFGPRLTSTDRPLE